MWHLVLLLISQLIDSEEWRKTLLKNTEFLCCLVGVIKQAASQDLFNSLTLLFLGFQNICEVWSVEQVVLLVNELEEKSIKCSQPALKATIVQVLKRMTCMQNEYIGDQILSIEELCDLIVDADFVTRQKGDAILAQMINRMRESLVFKQVKDHNPLLIPSREQYTRPPVRVELKTKEPTPVKRPITKDAQTQTVTVAAKNQQQVATPDLEQPLASLKVELQNQNNAYFNLLEENNDLKDRIKFIQADLTALQASKPANADLVECVSQTAEQILAEFRQSCQVLQQKVADLQLSNDSQLQLILEHTTKAKLQDALILELKSNLSQIESKETQIIDLKKALAIAVQRETLLSSKVLQMESKRPLSSIVLQQSVEQDIITDLYQQLMQTRSALLFQQVQLKQSNSKHQLAQIEAKSKSDIPKLDNNFVLEVVNYTGNLQDLSEQVNRALQSIQRSQVRQNFQEELCQFYEQRYQQILDSHEALLLEHLFLKQVTTDAKIDDYVQDLFNLTKKQRIKLSELEGELLAYKKCIALEPIKVEDAPLKKQDQKMIGLMLEHQKLSETKRLHAALDLLIKHNIHLEFEVLRQNQERLRNEYHWEQQEFQLKKNLSAGYSVGNWSASGDQHDNISKLVEQIEKVKANIKGNFQKDFSSTIAKQVKAVRMSVSLAREVKLEVKVKRAAGAHGVMEVSTGEGKKPRFVNDYEAPVRPSILNQYLDQIDSAVEIIQQAIQDQQQIGDDDDGLLKFQLLIDEVDLLKSGLETRGHEFEKLSLAWTRALYEKCDVQNSLTLALKGKKEGESKLKDQVGASLKNEIRLKEELTELKQKLMFAEQEVRGLKAQIRILKFGKQSAVAQQSEVVGNVANISPVIVPQKVPLQIAEPGQYKKEKVLQLLRSCLADGNQVTRTLIDFIFTKVTSQDDSNQVLVKQLRALHSSQELISEFTGVTSIEEAVRMKLRETMAIEPEPDQDLVVKYLSTITSMLETNFMDQQAVKNHLDCLGLMMPLILQQQFAASQDDSQLDMLQFEKTQLEQQVRVLEGKVAVIPSLQSTINSLLNQKKGTLLIQQDQEATGTILELVQLRQQKRDALMTIETLQTQTKEDQTTIYELQQILLQQGHPQCQTIEPVPDLMEGSDEVQLLLQINGTLKAEIQSLRQKEIRQPSFSEWVDRNKKKKRENEDLERELSQALTKIELMKVQHSQVFQQIQPDDLLAEHLKINLENSFGTDGRFELSKLISYINQLSAQLQSQSATIAQLECSKIMQNIQISSISDQLQKTDFECKMLHDKYITTLDQLQQLDFMYQELNDEHISANQAIQMYQASVFAMSEQADVIEAIVGATKSLVLTCIDVRKQRDMYRSKSVLLSQEAQKQKLKYKHSKQAMVQFQKQLFQIQQVKHVQSLEHITQTDLVLEVASLRAEIQVQKTYNSKALVKHISNQNLNHLHRMLAAESNAAALLIELGILRSQNINLCAKLLGILTSGSELAQGLAANQEDKLMLENDLLKEKIQDLTQQVQTMSMERELYSVNLNQMQVDALETKLRCQLQAWTQFTRIENSPEQNLDIGVELDPKTRFQSEQMRLRIKELENYNQELLAQCDQLTKASSDDLNKPGLQVMQLILQQKDRCHLQNQNLQLETELIAAHSKQDQQNTHITILSRQVQDLEAKEIRLLSDVQAMSLRLLVAVSGGDQQISQQLSFDNLQHQVVQLQQKLQALERDNRLLIVQVKSHDTAIVKFKQHHQMLIQQLELAREELIAVKVKRIGKDPVEIADKKKGLQVQKDFYIAQTGKIIDQEHKLAAQSHQIKDQPVEKLKQALGQDLEARLKQETAKVVDLMRKNNILVDQVLVLQQSEAKYDLEVKAHHKLNTQITVLEKQLTDIQKPSDYLGVSQRQQDLHFYDLLTERFLTQLSLYQDEIRHLKKSGSGERVDTKLESKLQKALDRNEFMWLRLDFQSRADHLIQTNELQQVIDAYKSEITKVRAEFKRQIQDQDLNSDLARQVRILQDKLSKQDRKDNRLEAYKQLKNVFHPEKKIDAVKGDVEFREQMVIGFVRSSGVAAREGEGVQQMERRLILAEDENIKLKSYVSELTLKMELFSTMRQRGNQPRRQLKTVTPNMIGEMPIRQLGSRQVPDDRMLSTGIGQSSEQRLTLPELDPRHLSSALSKQRNQNSAISQRDKKSGVVKFR